MSVNRPLAWILPIVLAAATAGQTVPAESPTDQAGLPGVIKYARPNAAEGPLEGGQTSLF